MHGHKMTSMVEFWFCQYGDLRPESFDLDWLGHLLWLFFQEGAVGSECDDSCKQRNMREMLRETFGIKTEIERLVQTSDADLQLDGGNNSIAVLNPGSFAMGSPTIECNEDGRVFTRTRQCGTSRNKTKHT